MELEATLPEGDPRKDEILQEAYRLLETRPSPIRPSRFRVDRLGS
jgi:hypothetical protein